MSGIKSVFIICTWIFAIGSLWLSAGPDASKEIPDPQLMQRVVWENMRLRDFTLRGNLRVDDGETRVLHPILLKTKGRKMVYEFLEQPLQIRVQLTPSGSIIDRRGASDEKWEMVSGKERLKAILNTDVAYEDLGVDFLRWGKVKPLGMDSIKTLKAWAYEAEPPALSNYAKARYWISADYLSILRVDAYNAAGKVIKRVGVNGVMRVGDSYVIKEMMISSMIPGRDLSSSRSYIQIKDAEPGSGLKLVD
ncbi:MAG: outer membrane lipoprotein-sorting protein [Verrucomicrobiota bacterium]